MQTPAEFESELSAIIQPIVKYQRHAGYAIRLLCASYLASSIFPHGPLPVTAFVISAMGSATLYSIFVVFRLIQAISSTPMAVAFALASAFPLFTLPILFSSNRMALADIHAAENQLNHSRTEHK